MQIASYAHYSFDNWKIRQEREENAKLMRQEETQDCVSDCKKEEGTDGLGGIW